MHFVQRLDLQQTPMTMDPFGGKLQMHQQLSKRFLPFVGFIRQSSWKGDRLLPVASQQLPTPFFSHPVCPLVWLPSRCKTKLPVSKVAALIGVSQSRSLSCTWAPVLIAFHRPIGSSTHLGPLAALLAQFHPWPPTDPPGDPGARAPGLHHAGVYLAAGAAPKCRKETGE